MYVLGGSITALALVGVLAWTRLAPAQPAAPPIPPAVGEEMTITVPEVEVRSGPGTGTYATSKLHTGDKVRVVKTDKNTPGWLAIKPPPGAVSWISATFVKRTAGSYEGVIVTDENHPVPVKPASSVTDEEPKNVESGKAPRGRIVVVRGPEKIGTGGAWLPIDPLDEEVRWIPESAVARTGVQPASATTTNGFVAPPGGSPSPVTEGDKLLEQAAKYYQQALQSSDPNLRQQAQARLQALQQVSAVQGAGQQPGYPNATPASAVKVQLGGNTTPAQATGGNTALYTGAPAGAAQWSKWGTLRKTAFQNQGQSMYRLEDERGTPLGYAVAAPGLTLEPYVGKMVCLYGTTAYSNEAMRGNYTIVSQLALP
jgi:hypothetical protein